MHWYKLGLDSPRPTKHFSFVLFLLIPWNWFRLTVSLDRSNTCCFDLSTPFHLWLLFGGLFHDAKYLERNQLILTRYARTKFQTYVLLTGIINFTNNLYYFYSFTCHTLFASLYLYLKIIENNKIRYCKLILYGFVSWWYITNVYLHLRLCFSSWHMFLILIVCVRLQYSGGGVGCRLSLPMMSIKNVFQEKHDLEGK